MRYGNEVSEVIGEELVGNEAESRTLRVERGEVGGDSDHVVDREFGNDWLHLNGGLAVTRARLHVEKLAEDVAGRAASDGRNVGESTEVVAVTGAAGDGASAFAGEDQGFSFFQTTRGHVGDEG